MTENPLFRNESEEEDDIGIEEGKSSNEDEETGETKVGKLLNFENEEDVNESKETNNNEESEDSEILGESEEEEEEDSISEKSEKTFQESNNRFESFENTDDTLDNIINEELKKDPDSVEEIIASTFVDESENMNTLNPQPADIFADVSIEDLDFNIESKYSNILEKSKDIEEESIFIENINTEKVELLKAFKEEEEVEGTNLVNFSKHQSVERTKKEKKIKKSVKKAVKKFRLQFNHEEKKRRKKYKQMSELARSKFRVFEDKLKLNLELEGANLETSKKTIDVHSKQFKLRWNKEPNQIDLRLCQLRNIGDKLKKGEYVMLISLYDRLGGKPIKYLKHGTKLKRASEPVFHRGHFRDVSLIFDQNLRITTVSKSDLTYRMVIIFELLFMKIGKGENSKVKNEIVGWGVFPLIDCNKNFIEGCFKVPFIKGELDSSIQKYSKIEKILKTKLEFWLGNFYFEAKHGEVDDDIVKNEEYCIEIIHEKNQDDSSSSGSYGSDDEEEDIYEEENKNYRIKNNNNNLSKFNSQVVDSPIFPKNDFFGGGAADDEEDNEDQDLMVKEMEEKLNQSIINVSSSNNNNNNNSEIISISKNQEHDENKEEEEEEIEEEGESQSSSEEKKSNEIVIEEIEEIEEEENDERENLMKNMNLNVYSAGKKKIEHVEIITAENPRIWFGKPRFGYIKEKDDWNEDFNLISSDEKDEDEDDSDNIENENDGKKIDKKKNKKRGGIGLDHPSTKQRTKEKIIVTKKLKEISIEKKESSSKNKNENSNPIFLSPYSHKAKKKREKKLNRTNNNNNSFLSGINSNTTSNLSMFNLSVLEDENRQEFPYSYSDEFKYKTSKFGVTRDRQLNEKTEKDVEKISHSFYCKILPEHGLTKTELVIYKQSVNRKQFSWKKSPIYLEKLRFIWRTTSMDLGMNNIRSFFFFFNLFFILFICFVRSYPHYLGQWLLLSSASIPYTILFPYGVYFKFVFRTQFLPTWFNFLYAAFGFLVNILFSVFLSGLTIVGQKVFKGSLPSIYYRFILFYIFSVCFESILTIFPDLVSGLIYDSLSEENYSKGYFFGDFFVLMNYYKNTEGSDLPGVLLSIGLFFVLTLIQLFVFYHYLVYIHNNQRVLDLYLRLNKPERLFYCPHDLEIDKINFLRIVDESKNYVGGRGKIMKVETSKVLLNLREIILLNRLKILLKSKKWPYDYISICLKKENKFFFTNSLNNNSNNSYNIFIPFDLLNQKRSGAALHRKTSFGKIFIINKFSFLSNAIYFDEIKNTTQQQRQNMFLNLLKKYRMIVPNMIERLKSEKAVQCVLLNKNLCYSDILVMNNNELEIFVPSLNQVKKEIQKFSNKQKIINYCCMVCCIFFYINCCCCCFSFCFKKRIKNCCYFFNNCMKNIRYRRNIIHPIIDNNNNYLDSNNNDGERVLRKKKMEKWEIETATTTIEDKYFDDRKKAIHIKIYCQDDNGILHIKRNFIQTPRGYICEVFNRKQNQLSVSNIALPNSTEYWINLAFEKTKTEEKRRKVERKRKKRNRRIMKAPMMLIKFKKAFEKHREKKLTDDFLNKINNDQVDHIERTKTALDLSDEEKSETSEEENKEEHKEED